MPRRLDADGRHRTGSADDADGAYARDLADQFDRVRSLADGESQFLFGVIELYQTKVNTKMTVAMERLAVIAAVTLPVTAIASVYGMNVIVNAATHWTQLVIVLVVMLTISLAAAALGPQAGLVVTDARQYGSILPLGGGRISSSSSRESAARSATVRGHRRHYDADLRKHGG